MNDTETPIQTNSVSEKKPSPKTAEYSPIIRYLSTFIKIAVSLIIVYWLIQNKRIDLSAISNIQFSFIHFQLLGISIILFCVGLLVLSFRIKSILSFYRYDISIRRCISLTVLPLFFGTLLPGMIGGDALKIFYICKNVENRKYDAFSCVVIDRAIGLFSLMILAQIMSITALIFPFISIPASIHYSIAALTVSSIIGLSLIASETLNRRILNRINKRLPFRLQPLLPSFRLFFQSKRHFRFVLLLSFVNHILVVTIQCIASIFINDGTPFAVQFVIIPIALLVNIIPLTPGGLGVYESALHAVYSFVGSPNGATLGILSRFIQYGVLSVWSLFLLFKFRYRHRILEAIEEKK